MNQLNNFFLKYVSLFTLSFLALFIFFVATVSGAASTVIGVDITTTGNFSVGGTSGLGTVTSGTWNGTAISEIYGGTNQTSYATGDIIYASALDTLSKLSVGSNGDILTLASGVPTWAASAGASVTVQNTGTTAIGTTDTTLLTAPSISLTGQPVKIFVSVQLENTAGGARTATFKLLRDGSEVSLTDRYSEELVPGDDNEVRSFHFYDTPGTGSFVYSIDAIADNTGINVKTNSRLTVTD